MGEGMQASAWRLDRKQEASLDCQLFRPPRKELLGSLSRAIMKSELSTHPSAFLRPMHNMVWTPCTLSHAKTQLHLTWVFGA